MASWDEWIQDVAGTVIKTKAQADYIAPYEIQRMRLQAYGDVGMYDEGYRGVGGQVLPGGQVSPVLIVGALLVVAVLVLK